MSRTEDPGTRSSTDEALDWGIAIYDRISPDFINLVDPVKLTGIRANRTRRADPARRLALSAPDLASCSRRPRHCDRSRRGIAPVGRLHDACAALACADLV